VLSRFTRSPSGSAASTEKETVLSTRAAIVRPQAASPATKVGGRFARLVGTSRIMKSSGTWLVPSSIITWVE